MTRNTVSVPLPHRRGFSSRQALCATVASMLLTTGLVSSCSSDGLGSPTDPETVYWSLRLDHHAVQLALATPGNTVQLSAQAYTPSGSVWTPSVSADGSNLEWISTDSSKVRVTQNGLVTARAVTSGIVRVIARRKVGNITLADTSQVRVVAEATPRILDTIQMRPTDSLIRAMSLNSVFTFRATDTARLTMNGVIGYVTTSDTTIAKPIAAWSVGTSTTTITMSTRRVGSVLVTITSWVYGVAQRDTFTLRVGYPITAFVSVLPTAVGDGTFTWYGSGLNNRVIGPGGVITWYNNSRAANAPGQPMDVLFDNPSAALEATGLAFPGTGNILAIPADTGNSGLANRQRNRKFLAEGAHAFRIPQYNLSGVIVVKPTP